MDNRILKSKNIYDTFIDERYNNGSTSQTM